MKNLEQQLGCQELDSLHLTCSGGLVLVKASPPIKSFLEKILTIDDVPFYNDGCFPRGLLQYVLDKCKNENIPVQVTGAELYNYSLDDVPSDLLKGITLTDYQRHAIRKILCVANCLIEAPPGFGKTIIYCGVVKVLSSKIKNLKTLLITGRVKHMEQFATRMEECGIRNVGKIGEGFMEEDKDHYVAVSNTIFNWIKAGDPQVLSFLKDVKVLAFDESHHLGTSFTWQSIAGATPSAIYRIGLSAYQFEKPEDPYSSSVDTTLVAITGPLIYKIPASVLISQGYLAKPIIYKIVINDDYIFLPFEAEPSWVDVRFKDANGRWIGDNTLAKFLQGLGYSSNSISSITKALQEGRLSNLLRNDHKPLFDLNKGVAKGIYRYCIVENKRRNEIIIRLIKNISRDSNRRILVIVNYIEHGKLLQGMLIPFGVSSVFNYGGKSISYLSENGEHKEVSEEKLFDMFEAGEFKVLIGSAIYDEAIDIPFITDLILAAGMKVPRRQLQRVGRALRKTIDKYSVRIFDFQDNQSRVTANHSRARFKMYNSEGFEVTTDIPLYLLEK